MLMNVLKLYASTPTDLFAYFKNNRTRFIKNFET